MASPTIHELRHVGWRDVKAPAAAVSAGKDAARGISIKNSQEM